MTTLRFWFIGIFAAALLLHILYSFVPQGAFRKICRLLGGFTMVLVIVKPLLHCDVKDILSQYEITEESLQETIDTYQQEITDCQSAIIQDEVAAYIAKKASTMGIACTVSVQCELVDGTPFPTCVALDIPYNSELAKIIEEELGILREEQTWQGESS